MIKEYIWGTEDWLYEDNGILIKRIDSHDKLSVQVHPIEKTESWYIESCDEDSFIYLGCDLENTDDIRDAALDGSIEDHLNKIMVHSGEFFFIPYGTIHAIGKGCRIIEVQQDANITYRLYDYKRKDASGQERELHVDNAVSVIRHDKMAGKKQLPFSCDFFSVDEIEKDHEKYIRVNNGLIDIKIT